MPIQKDPELASVVTSSGATSTKEFDHDGKHYIVEYIKPTVAIISEARSKAMKIEQRGRSVKYQMDILEFEINLFMKCCKDSNIPGVPQVGRVAVLNINDNQLWEKLLVACEIRDADGAPEEDLVSAATEVVEALGTEHPALAKLNSILNAEVEDEDVKK